MPTRYVNLHVVVECNDADTNRVIQELTAGFENVDGVITNVTTAVSEIKPIIINTEV